MSPWLSIVLLGIAITGYAWIMPKSGGKGKPTEFVSEEAYDLLLQDLETENRELVDAVAKFKREQNETVDKLGRRIVDMEQQMIKWLEQSPPETAKPSMDIGIATSEAAVTDVVKPESSIEILDTTTIPNMAVAIDEIVLPKTTIRGRYPELLDMHDKGRSVEQIAKAMGMNKGEVQLILQLVRREEEHHE